MIILVLITILLDYLLIYFIPSYFNNINFLYPMLTITLIVYLYKKTDSKKYFKTVFLIGLLYDIVFSYIFLFNSLMFLMFAKIIKKLDRYFRINLVISLILVVLFIFLYDLVLFILVYISSYNKIFVMDLLYKVKNSIILNVFYYVLLTIIFKNKKRIMLKK